MPGPSGGGRLATGVGPVGPHAEYNRDAHFGIPYRPNKQKVQPRSNGPMSQARTRIPHPSGIDGGGRSWPSSAV